MGDHWAFGPVKAHYHAVNGLIRAGGILQGRTVPGSSAVPGQVKDLATRALSSFRCCFENNTNSETHHSGEVS